MSYSNEKNIGLSCLLFALSFLATSVLFAEELKITTYYPSPYGVYLSLRLVPSNSQTPEASCDNPGELFFYDGSDNKHGAEPYFCDPKTDTWLPVSNGPATPSITDLWVKDGTDDIKNNNTATVNIDKDLDVGGTTSIAGSLKAGADLGGDIFTVDAASKKVAIGTTPSATGADLQVSGDMSVGQMLFFGTYATTPAVAQAGAVYFNSTTKILYLSNGTLWIPLNTGECDFDHDGYANSYCGGNDCNDNDAAINPGTHAIAPDGKDNNCDGIVDNFNTRFPFSGSSYKVYVEGEGDLITCLESTSQRCKEVGYLGGDANTSTVPYGSNWVCAQYDVDKKKWVRAVSSSLFAAGPLPQGTPCAQHID